MICKTARWLLSIGLLICALLAGCKGGVKLVDDYGVIPPPSHPTVQLTDFSYTPGESIHAGDTLTLTAITSLPLAQATISATARPVGGGAVLLDDGQPPDEIAGDGVWTAEYTVPADTEPTSEAYFFVDLEFSNFYRSQTLKSDEYEVLPAEEE